MKRICTHLGLLWVLCVVTATLSPVWADGMARGSTKDGPVVSGYSWQGFYVGAHAGLANGSADTTSAVLSTQTDLSGALYGVQVGYNWQRDTMVFGLEGTWSAADIDGSNLCSIPITCRREVDWVATLVGRAGWAMNHTLLYGFGGVAWGNVNAIGSFPGLTISGDETHVGWTAGFGLEHALNQRVSFRIEYAHIDLGSDTHSLTNSGGFGPVQAKVDTTLDTVRLGVNLKLSN
jgi:outer membrane immunogenic protein